MVDKHCADTSVCKLLSIRTVNMSLVFFVLMNFPKKESIFFFETHHHQFDATRVLLGTRGVVSIVTLMPLLGSAILHGFWQHQQPH